MANLLPQQYLDYTRKERHIRVFIVIIVMLATTAVVGSFSLTPALVLSQASARDAERAVDLTRQSIAQQESGGILEKIRLTRNKIDRLEAELSFIEISDVLITIDDATLSGITLSSISYDRRGETNDTVSLSGVAGTREELLSFTQRLDREALFSNVIFPVSSLAQSTNIGFSLTFDVLADGVVEEVEETDGDVEAETLDS